MICTTVMLSHRTRTWLPCNRLPTLQLPVRLVDALWWQYLLLTTPHSMHIGSICHPNRHHNPNSLMHQLRRKTWVTSCCHRLHHTLAVPCVNEKNLKVQTLGAYCMPCSSPAYYANARDRQQCACVLSVEKWPPVCMAVQWGERSISETDGFQRKPHKFFDLPRFPSHPPCDQLLKIPELFFWEPHFHLLGVQQDP